MTNDTECLLVLTGGPGSGKTTLIEALARAGHAYSIEAGRAIIQDQVAIDGPALPWRDPPAFAELMLCWEMRSWRLAQDQGVVFFDRGVPDVVGYLRLLGLPVPSHMDNAARAFRYNRRVFIAPPWPEIFQRDNERRQDFDEAVRTYEAMVATYRDYGYELIELPRAAVEERVRFVLEHAGLAERTAPPRLVNWLTSRSAIVRYPWLLGVTMTPGGAPGILRKGYWIMRGSEKLLRVPHGAVGDISKEHLAMVERLVADVKGTLGWWCEYGQPGDPDILCTKIQVPRERAGVLLQSVLDSRMVWEIDDAFPYGTPPYPEMVQLDLSLRGLER